MRAVATRTASPAVASDGEVLYDGTAAITAMVAAGSRVRTERRKPEFGWLIGAPSHVLAELLDELREDGWQLVRTGRPSAGVSDAPARGRTVEGDDR